MHEDVSHRSACEAGQAHRELDVLGDAPDGDALLLIDVLDASAAPIRLLQCKNVKSIVRLQASSNECRRCLVITNHVTVEHTAA